VGLPNMFSILCGGSMVVRDGCLPVNFGRDAVGDLSVGQSGTKSVCVVGERPVPQSFLVNLGPIYFMGEGRNPSAPDVTRH
jgi:hypothetical protein